MSGEMQLAAMLLRYSMPEAILPRQWLNLMGSGACKLNALNHNGLSRYTNYVILSLLTNSFLLGGNIKIPTTSKLLCLSC